MSDVENIFLGVDVSLRRVADEWLTPLLGLEAMPDGLDSEEEIGLRGRAGDGWLVLLVRRNGYAEIAPEPDEVQAFDAYPIEIAVRYPGGAESAQQREVRRVFDQLVAARPEVPMLLVHDLDVLVAAHLPGVGTEYFGETVTVDAPDRDKWAAWVHCAVEGGS
jgi:hypothetical protein